MLKWERKSRNWYKRHFDILCNILYEILATIRLKWKNITIIFVYHLYALLSTTVKSMYRKCEKRRERIIWFSSARCHNPLHCLISYSNLMLSNKMQIMFIIWSTWCSAILEQVIRDPKNIITPLTVLAHRHVVMSFMIKKDNIAFTSHLKHWRREQHI